ncbi:MAG: GntR family transcriptional regulator [Lentisphaeria bacterium]|nr:GntR family transcriptional regulator [Lentisphaeria bacterium]
MPKNNQGQQTEMVKKQLISLIREGGLKIGERLPPQAELRKKLGVGSKTIQRAIETLAESNVLEIRPHKGVFIRQLETDGFIGHEIGLVCMWRTFSPSTASLMQCLQLQMHSKACQCKLFLRNFPEMTKVDSLSYFDGLKRCIEQKQIQGLISTVSFDKEAWAFFREHDLPVVSLGSAAFNGGFKVSGQVDLNDMFKQSRKRRFRRPAVIFCGFPVTAQIRKKFERNCSLDPDIFCRSLTPEMEIEDRPYQWTGDLYEILHQFAGMRKTARPDVLLIPDDIITSIAHRELLKMQLNGCDWDPFFIYQTTRQMPILPEGSVHGDYFESDTMRQAETAVKLLLDIIAGKETGERSVHIKTKLHEAEEK